MGMKSLSEMSLVEFQEHISKLMELYRDNKIDNCKSRSFILGGILFNENTPKEDWDWLDRELQNA